MHATAIKKIAEDLLQVAKSVAPPGQGGFMQLRIHNDVAYTISPEAATVYAEQVRLLLNHADFSEKFTEAYLTQKLDEIFAAVLNEKGGFQLEGALNKLIQDCANFNNPVSVFLTLEGVQLETNLQLCDVLLLPGTEAFLHEMSANCETIVSQSKGDLETKKMALDFLVEQCKKELKGQCVVTYVVNAEPSRAVERARLEARFAIDLLRFVSKHLYPLSEDVRIGLKGERPATRRTAFVLSSTNLSTKSDSLGSVLSFHLNSDALGKMDQLGLLALSERARTKKLSDLDKLIVRSIHWVSVALTQDEPETALVTLITALECLFKAEQGNSLGGTVAEATAFVLSDTSTGRRAIAKAMRDFYGKRSAVAHGGKKTASENDKALLIQYVSAVILVVLNEMAELKSQQDLMSWIDEKKFGS